MYYARLLKAVIVDLTEFALGTLVPRGQSSSGAGEHIIYVSPRPERMALTAPTSAAEEKPLPHAHLASVFEHAVALPQKNTIAYVASSGAPLRSTHQTGVDNIIARMPFGSMLVAVEQVGEWVRVFYAGLEGYVELVDLADRAAYVHPKFIIGEENSVTDANTERLRAMISDEFSYAEGDAPLQAEEYVLYKLMRNGVRPTWPPVRPRTPGSWHRILRDASGVHISAEPSPRSVIEFAVDEGAHIAFVEAVFPDGAIQISEANWPERGIYNERVIVREEWRTLTPTFISFT